MAVLQLHTPKPADDIVDTLRLIADQIAAGEIGWPVTTAVLLLGHTGSEKPDDDGHWQEMCWRTYGMGPRADAFTVRGLMGTALNRWGHDD